MVSISDIRIWLIWLFIGQILGASYNQPKFCANASWNPNATTIADRSIVGTSIFTIFITTNNTIYVPNQITGDITVLSGNQSTLARNIRVNSADIRGLFVLTEDVVYYDAFSLIGGVSKWTSNSNITIPVMYTCTRCYGLFIAIDDMLYCSLDGQHQVIKKSLNDKPNMLTVVAGTGVEGSTADTLDYPNGLFVDVNFDLYVADCLNDRIQLFQSGQLNGITVAGSGSLTYTITLDRPTGIVLDADKYLFIADYFNHRIVGSGPNGFRCLVGCSGSWGTSANELHSPRAFHFDSYGNIFVLDEDNTRIQKFLLMTNSCNQTTTANTRITSTFMTSLSTNMPSNLAINNSNNISYNQPKLNLYAMWNSNGITFTNRSTIGLQPSSIFINNNNTIYAVDREHGRIQVWLNNNRNPSITIYGNLTLPNSIFVTTIGDIYTDNNRSTYQVNRWSLNSNKSTVVMNMNEKCYGLVIDRNNKLYCSVRDLHQVIRQSLNDNSSILTIVAGTGCYGSTANLLFNPNGIFIDNDFNLYVADSGNNRIQLYQSTELNGITIVGSNSTNTTIALNYPTGIVLDADKYLFIVDSGNHRIIGSGPNGFRCIIGCSGSGSASNQLINPQTMAFDSYGNIFVVDRDNNRIQKFLLITNSSVNTTVFSTTTGFQQSNSSNKTTTTIITTTTTKFNTGLTTSTITMTTSKLNVESTTSGVMMTTSNPHLKPIFYLGFIFWLVR